MPRRERARGQKQRVWQPMRKGQVNPRMIQAAKDVGEDDYRMEAWGNDLYDAIVRYMPTTSIETGEYGGELIWISVKSHGRHPIRDWRHLQQIKNEIAGPEREAVEIFPAESRLVDTTNEFHLWVLPEGQRIPWGYNQRSVMEPKEIRAYNAEEKAQGGQGKARQRPWQPGLTTGLGDE